MSEKDRTGGGEEGGGDGRGLDLFPNHESPPSLPLPTPPSPPPTRGGRFLRSSPSEGRTEVDRAPVHRQRGRGTVVPGYQYTDRAGGVLMYRLPVHRQTGRGTVVQATSTLTEREGYCCTGHQYTDREGGELLYKLPVH